MKNKNEQKTETKPEVAPPAQGSTVVKTAAVFAAYLCIAMPYNMAMAAEWQTPQQVAALSDEASPQATSITVTTRKIEQSHYYQITNQDVAAEVASQLTAQGVEKKARALLAPSASPIIYAADHPLKLSLHALQIDPGSRRWQAQANIIANGKTEIVKPVSGTYEGVISVPVLTRQLRSGEIIEASDLSTRDLSSRQMRKDTITNADALIGQSPRGMISADRPIRLAEISAPVVIRKGDLVELRYTTKYMHIKTTGIALENGELNGPIRVKNEKSEKAVSGRAVAAGEVEVNTEAALDGKQS